MLAKAEAHAAQREIEVHAIQYGEPVKFYIRDKSQVTFDAGGSVKFRSEVNPLTINAFPMNYSPSRREREKVGIKEEVDAIAYTPAIEWDKANVSFRDVSVLYSTVTSDAGTYEITSKYLNNQIGNRFLYWVFGLSKL